MSALDNEIIQLQDSITKAGVYANGDQNTDVSTPNGPIPSIAKQYKQNSDKVNGLVPDIANRLRVDAPGGYDATQQAQARANIGLSHVDDVPDADKPISGPQQQAINGVIQLANAKEDPINRNGPDGYVGLQGYRIVLINDAGTVVSTLSTTATGVHNWTMPDKSGAVALLDDITGTNSGVNTGDETTATIKGKLSITTLTGNNTGDETNATLLNKLNISSISGVNTGDETQASILAKLPYALIDPVVLDQASGIAVLDGNRLVAFERLPDSVKNLVKVATITDLPNPGNPNALYLTIDEGLFYHYENGNYNPAGTTSLGSTDQLAEGSLNLYFTQQRVNDAVIFGFGPTDGSPVNGSDTVAIAVSKLQAQASVGVAEMAQREHVSNKVIDFAVLDDDKYPTVKAVNTKIAAAVASALVQVLIDCGNWDASGHVFPSVGGTGTSGAIVKGNLFYVSAAGVLGGQDVNIGDSFRALVDNPGQTAANWDILESNLGYVPYNSTNPAGYTANSTDEFLLDRTHHTGSQSAFTIDETASRVFVLPAEKTAITHANRAALDQVSGINTGDQTLASLAAQGTASKDANGGYVGLTAFKINFKNTDGSIGSFLTNASTVSRNYAFPDKDGTVAMLSDITGTNTGVNTGDETLASIQTKLVSTTNLPEGSNQYFTGLRAIGSVLTGYVIAGANAAVAATDSILVAFGKQQKQINDLQTSNTGTNTGDETTATIKTKLGVTTLSGSNTGDETLATIQTKLVSTANLSEGSNLYFTVARVLASALTGFAASNAVVIATDTVVAAFGKLQGQINAMLTSIAGKAASGINSDITSLTAVTALAAGTTAPGLLGSSATVSAAGTNQATGTVLTADVTVIGTAAAGTAVVMVNANGGRTAIVVNRGANPVLVYPAVGHQFDGLGVNAAITLPVNGLLEALGSSTTQWNTSLQAIVSASFIQGQVAIAQGGTGAATASAALTALGAAGLAGNTFTAAQNYSQVDKGTVSSGTVTFDASAKNVQKLTVGGALTIATSNWPASGTQGDLEIELVNGGAFAVTFTGISWLLPTTGAPAASFSAYLTAIGRSPASLQTAGTDWIYLWTTNGGTTINGKVM